MAWTAPMTAVAGTAFTAAQFNTYVRDNLNTTAPAVASAAGNIIVTTGLNAVTERVPSVGFVVTSQTTTNTSFVDLATVGPTVTVTTGIKCMVTFGCLISNSSVGQGGRMGIDLSGASTQVAADANSILAESGNANDGYKLTWSTIFNPLTPGSNVWKAKYRCAGSGTAAFAERVVAIVPF